AVEPWALVHAVAFAVGDRVGLRRARAASWRPRSLVWNAVDRRRAERLCARAERTRARRRIISPTTENPCHEADFTTLRAHARGRCDDVCARLRSRCLSDGASN